MPGALDSCRYLTLEFQAVSGDAARQDLTLLVDKLKQKIRVFVINVLDAKFFKAAILLAILTDFRIAKKFYIVS
jgi:hypothetical protein